MSQLVKATLVNLNSPNSADGKIECMFNPPSYEFTKENSWVEQVSKGLDTPGVFEFNGGKSADLSLDLFFDTHMSGEDVRTKYTNKIWKLALVDSSKKDSVTNKSKPPMVEFRWGKTWSFKAVVVRVSQKFTLFLADGTPTRAEVKVTLRQVEAENQYPGQNPTSGGTAGHRVHVVQQRETLDLIASREYGEPKYWRHIAEANGLTNPMALKPGMTLSLPPIEV